VEQSKELYEGRYKKIISAAWLCFFETATASIYRCPCGYKDKKSKGCVRPTRQPQVVFECPVCGGSDRKCIFCFGKNEIKIHRCPRAIVTPDLALIIPYFVDYVSALPRPIYPDGRTRLFQPTKLINLFAVWLKLYKEIKAKVAPNEQ
jgi:hypothetical protein